MLDQFRKIKSLSNHLSWRQVRLKKGQVTVIKTLRQSNSSKSKRRLCHFNTKKNFIFFLSLRDTWHFLTVCHKLP